MEIVEIIQRIVEILAYICMFSFSIYALIILNGLKDILNEESDKNDK